MGSLDDPVVCEVKGVGVKRPENPGDGREEERCEDEDAWLGESEDAVDVEGPRASRGTPQSSHTRDAAGLRPEEFLYAHTWHSQPPTVSAAPPFPPASCPP